MRHTRYIAMPVIIGLLLAAAGTTTGQAASTPTVPSPHSNHAKAHAIGSTEVAWGKTKDGKSFSYKTKVGDATPAAAPAASAVSGSCSLYISDLTLDSSHNFEWDTDQICSGDYGTQSMTTWLWRSSWLGWRDYNSSGGTSPTTDYFIYDNWWERCAWGGGHYDYTAVVQGWTSGWGSSPLTESTHGVSNQPCGTSS